jgi:membrane associated rhomboid family serine protease
MGGLVPLGDATPRPVRMPVVTGLLIAANCFVFALELHGGDAFVTRWSAIPAQVLSGHRWITILSAMFMHASWSHIVGNMVFLWAFGPEIEDSMGRARYILFYLAGGFVATLAQIAADPHSTVPNLGASGAIAAVMGAFIVTYPRDRIRVLLFLFVFFRVTFTPLRNSSRLAKSPQPDPVRASDRLLVSDPTGRCGVRGERPIGRRRLPGACRRLPLWGGHGAPVPPATPARGARKTSEQVPALKGRDFQSRRKDRRNQGGFSRRGNAGDLFGLSLA